MSKIDVFYAEDDRCIRLEDLGEDFYSSKTFTDKLLEYLGDRSRDEEIKDKPFFLLILPTVHHTGRYRHRRRIFWNTGPFTVMDKRFFGKSA